MLFHMLLALLRHRHAACLRFHAALIIFRRYAIVFTYRYAAIAAMNRRRRQRYDSPLDYATPAAMPFFQLFIAFSHIIAAISCFRRFRYALRRLLY